MSRHPRGRHPPPPRAGRGLCGLDRQLPVETAARMRGLARVTGAFPAPDAAGLRYVVGTPSYVEFAAG